MDGYTLSILETLWWLGFWTAIGLCIGSFLNVVIFRLPRDRSLRQPLWSACPHCDHRIRWYDNLPLLSYVLLGGRCRDCRASISPRYMVIEASMALTVLLLLDAFFVGATRTGISHSPIGLTDQLATDWPILLAHIVLFACLLSMSAIDLEHYWVDVRFTNFATLVGFGLHAIWTPRHSIEWIRPSDTTAVVSIGAVVGLGITMLVLVCQPHVDAEDFGEEEFKEPEATVDGQTTEDPIPFTTDRRRRWAWIAAVPVIALLFALLAEVQGFASIAHTMRAAPILLLLVVLIVWESTTVRDSDHEIMEAIDAERHTARSMVMTELLLLLPAIALGIAGAWAMQGDGIVAERIARLMDGHGGLWGVPSWRGWNPMQGLATAASGYIIAGALGWFVRILFTLILGKEAFGTGDIHMMAAAGCIAGWPVVVLGFFVAVLLALIGWLIALPFKKSRAIPLGPWLSVAFLIVVIYYDAMLEWPFIERVVRASHMLFL